MTATPFRAGPSFHQWGAWGYFVILAGVASLNYLPIPGIVDENGLCFGIFALDLFDDALHVGSALWAGLAAWRSPRAARFFLLAFGALYLADGLLGLATGSGYLDAGILRWGVQDYGFVEKVYMNLPHVGLGLVAVLLGAAPRT
ncbi:hypothetical protein [Wenxinia saemankumensis]|uniref:DUF4383 domain-containing protein n=1 Tax=Wenxinia saemankumensis TaxID=1447782 RepID=A0A1M6FWC2_9RHOB|nr:hypothetical protein [Wenxinia saemankumensis]SHJ01986.1 hypothetical protein SAMN05444417_2538 [Wenxinia saemankumensis]